MLYNSYIPCILGLFLGAIYGFLFIKNSEIAPTFSTNILFRSFSKIRFILIRIAIIGTLWLTLLHSSSLMIILATSSFLMGFWIIIIRKKVRHREQP